MELSTTANQTLHSIYSTSEMEILNQIWLYIWRFAMHILNWMFTSILDTSYKIMKKYEP
jgi:hypothetical protein